MADSASRYCVSAKISSVRSYALADIRRLKNRCLNRKTRASAWGHKQPFPMRSILAFERLLVAHTGQSPFAESGRS